jgi:hypothetical protein
MRDLSTCPYEEDFIPKNGQSCQLSCNCNSARLLRAISEASEVLRIPSFLRHFNVVSQLVILITFVLFVVALFVKDFGYVLLIEIVLVISVKLIMVAHRTVLSRRIWMIALMA